MTTTKPRFLKLPAVIEITGKSKTAIYDEMGKGVFPRRYPIGLRAVGWLESEIYEWVENKVKQASHA